jgi:electron transfer flavoprotein alpha subunit
MEVTSKALWAVLVALALSLAGSLVWGFYQRGEARVLQTKNNRLEADLVAMSKTVQAFEADARQRAEIDAKQSTDRAKQAQAVRATRDELKKEEVNAKEPRPVASDRQLDRLRRLADAANASIRATSELP